MEQLDTVAAGLSAIGQVLVTFRSLKDKAPNAGANEEFTVQLNDAIIEMQQAVITAQQMALSAQSREAGLQARIDGLEQAIARAGEWETTKARYQLKDVSERGGMVYALREELVGEDEPNHYICPKCYQDQIKSILQYTGNMSRPYWCTRCNP